MVGTKQLDLGGKVVLVTGAAQRLGATISRQLAAAGADVVLHCHASAGQAAKLAQELGALGRRAWVVTADLNDPTAVAQLFPRVVAEAGPVDLLVNNAAIFPCDKLANISLENLEQNLRVNAWSPFVLGRAMAGQKRPGAIVNLLDCRMHDYDAEHVSYQLSKRMLFTLTRMAAIEYAPLVRVNAVAPGLILPPPGENESYLERLASTNPLQAYGSATAVAEAVEYLMRATFVTGQVIHVDGGRHMRSKVYG